MLHNLCVSRGGAERLVLSLSGELRKLGYDVDVFVMRYDQRVCFPELVGETRVTGLSRVFRHDVFRAIPPLQALELALRLPKGYDIIHAHNFPSVIAAFLATKLNRSNAGTPYIWQCNEPPRILHEQDEIDRYYEQAQNLPLVNRAGALLGLKIMHATSRTLDKLAAQNAAFVTTLSRYAGKQIERVYGRQATILSPGIDLQIFNPSVEGTKVRRKYGINDAFLLLTVSRLWPAKNVETALKAFRIVLEQFPRTFYMIVGDGPSKFSLQSLASKIRLDDKVVFVSDTEVEVLADFYAACNVFVFPALGEPWGLSLLEAMATGKPVIAARDGGPQEIVEDKHDGFLVEPMNPYSYAEAILRLFKDQSVSESIGKNAATKAKAYSWERMAKRYSEIYKQLMPY
ncbi:MAG: glycosyltransferase family 4 protein [Candidatus Bathyarchaeota archaeon]|nr:glycosyltransferase family 4 protein [Candidatus Bathyarchaeota archaeon]